MEGQCVQKCEDLIKRKQVNHGAIRTDKANLN